MRTEEEGVGPDLVAMLERVRLLVALILDDNKQPGHQRRQKQQRFAVSRIFDAAHNCEATADVPKDLHEITSGSPKDSLQSLSSSSSTKFARLSTHTNRHTHNTYQTLPVRPGRTYWVWQAEGCARMKKF